MNLFFFSQDIMVESYLLFPAALGKVACYEDRIIRHMAANFLEGHCFVANQTIRSSYLPRGFLADNVDLFIKDTECWEGAWV